MSKHTVRRVSLLAILPLLLFSSSSCRFMGICLVGEENCTEAEKTTDDAIDSSSCINSAVRGSWGSNSSDPTFDFGGNCTFSGKTSTNCSITATASNASTYSSGTFNIKDIRYPASCTGYADSYTCSYTVTYTGTPTATNKTNLSLVCTSPGAPNLTNETAQPVISQQ